MKKKLSIIIPCFNERKTIYKIVNKILKLKKLNKEIIVVDDHSKDGSKEIIENLEKKKLIGAIYHRKNLGKGACVISAKKKIKGDFVVIQDADLEYYPSDLIKIFKKLNNSKYKVVYGSRILKKKYFENLKNFSHWIRIIGNIFLTSFSNILNNQKLSDAHTCYKAFDAKTFKNIKLNEKNFNFCPEITTKISNLGIKIAEVPIRYKGRDYKEGKKIKFTDAFKAIYCILKYKLF